MSKVHEPCEQFVRVLQKSCVVCRREATQRCFDSSYKANEFEIGVKRCAPYPWLNVTGKTLCQWIGFTRMVRTPISLYLDLENGEKADLEVVAKASLAFAAAMRDLAYVLDPSLSLKIEITSGTEGSFSLNSMLRAIKEASDQPLTLKALAIVALVWFGQEAGGHIISKELDALMGWDEAPVALSEADLNKIQAMVNKALSQHIAQAHVAQVYRELERDPHIKGVGASPKPATRPTNIVPRAEFPQRSAVRPTTELLTIERRERTTSEHVTLIKPVLLNAHRRWRFSYQDGQFSAAVTDDKFLSDMDDGTLGIPLSGGIEMDIELLTVEEKKDGVWQIVNRVVTRVTRWQPRVRHAQLPLRGSLADNSDDNDDED